MSRPRRKRQQVIDLEAVSDSDEYDSEYDSAEDSPGSLVDFIVSDSDDGDGFESDVTYELSEEDGDSQSEAEFTDSDYEEEIRKHHCPRCNCLMTPDDEY